MSFLFNIFFYYLVNELLFKQFKFKLLSRKVYNNLSAHFGFKSADSAIA